MTRVLIIGAGGHGQVVADILARAHEAGEKPYPIGFLDDNLRIRGSYLLGLPVLGGIDELHNFAHDAVILGIGRNDIRRHLFLHLQRDGEIFVTARHPAAVVAPDVTIGAGTVIVAGAIVNPGAKIGCNVILNTGCSVDHHNFIGDHAHIAPGVRLGGDVHIGDGALIGISATVMPQRRVGRESIVGAGALVTKDLADGTTAAGVPARIIANSYIEPLERVVLSA